jgi:hypothetical protein
MLMPNTESNANFIDENYISLTNPRLLGATKVYEYMTNYFMCRISEFSISVQSG